MEPIDFELIKRGAYTAAEMNSQLFASAVTMPVLMFQVLEDAWTKNPEDAQKTFDLISSAEKELFWIENTTKRFRLQSLRKASGKGVGLLRQALEVSPPKGRTSDSVNYVGLHCALLHVPKS